MEKASLNNFKREINQIRTYIKHVQYTDSIANYPVILKDAYNETINELLLELKAYKNHYTKFKDKRIFVYKSIIISLYGILEKYVELWIKEFLFQLSMSISYHLLPEKIKTQHFTLSTQLISMIIEARWDKYNHLTKEGLLTNLYNCIHHPNHYRLNTDAFVIQSGNLKHSRIVEMFQNMGLRLNELLVKNKGLNETIGISFKRVANTEPNILYRKIDDLVDRRNAIAHGVDIIDDILSNSILGDYIFFLEKCCHAIFEILEEEYMKIEAQHNYQKIEIVHNVWNNKIIGFELENYCIQVGDFMIVKTANHQYKRKIILNIQKDGKDYPSIEISKKTNIAVEVQPKVKKNCTFFLKKQKQ